MKRYAGKCHLLVRTNASAAIKTDNSDVNNRRCEKLSWVKFDRRLIFSGQILDLCKKTIHKIHAIARI